MSAKATRVAAGTAVARLDTSDVEIALRRARGRPGPGAWPSSGCSPPARRAEDIRQASAQAESADADVQAAESELANAAADVQRFEALLKANAGSRKQRDDAATRRDVAAARVAAARQRARAATEGVARLKAGSRAEEIAGARARVAAADAQIAALQKNARDAVLTSPVAGVVTAKLVDPGETRRPAHADCRRHRPRSRRGRTCTSTSRWSRGCASGRRSRSSPTPAQRLDGTDHLHLAAAPSSRRATCRPRTSGRGSCIGSR